MLSEKRTIVPLISSGLFDFQSEQFYMRKTIGCGIFSFVVYAIASWMLLTFAVGWPAIAFAADEKTAAKSKDEENEPPPKPKAVTLTTADQIPLKATYYPGSKEENSIPIILVHATKGDRSDLEDLALYLQGLGHAVIAPDLRGHGENPHFTIKPADYDAIIAHDMEAVKRFLRDENNEKKLNIDALCIVGVGSGAVVAINYARADWSYLPLSSGKQGQDVKALVMISPDLSIKGLGAKDALADPLIRANLSVLVIYGEKNSKAAKEAKLVYQAFERYHPTPPPAEALEKQDLFKVTPATALQGAKLLNEENFKSDLQGNIGKFIELRLVKKAFPWALRRNPLEK